MNKTILIALVVVLVLGAAGGGLYFSGMLGGGGKSGEATEAKEHSVQPIYLPLEPPFVVNFTHRGTLRYLQVTLDVMSYSPLVVEQVQMHMPAIRNGLIMLFSGQSYESLSSREGKESLRGDIAFTINNIIVSGDGKGIDDVFLTSFVMQ